MEKEIKEINAGTRLYHMGLTDLSGSPEELGISFAASLLAGWLYDDSLEKDLETACVLQTMKEHQKAGAYRDIYLYLILRFYHVCGTIPAPLLYIANSQETMQEFLCAFILTFEECFLESSGIRMITDNLKMHPTPQTWSR